MTRNCGNCNIGDRIIYKEHFYSSHWFEAEVLEFTTDKLQIKLKLHRSDGSKYILWEEMDEINEIKILAPRKKRRGK